ncbi:hypothetical protein S7711_03598 [Stachybotrys chartarum IBT 7711]|uniref:Zn(2)-C6 fungal-type domain-containing protein n=1 Tax=Stachybotrys chartarum (strain CBS 109288 / IBT 7711) TaxID=1280523 RepID=A0A084AGV2_STACB|nr:hypothetical protein S7711_03598 [Stachybotrys chartarum IBT 7711]
MNTTDGVQKKNVKSANQAWRKKPRAFAPKSRRGCKTCKYVSSLRTASLPIRRVKCDLSRPSCFKCQSTGRTCDGYHKTPFASEIEIGSSPSQSGTANREEHCGGSQPCITISAYQPIQWQARDQYLIVQNLGPFMILPVTGPGQTDAMSFFEHISIKHLNEYHPCESWRNTLMLFSQTVPSVRYAAIALSLIHRNYMDRESSDRAHQMQSSRGRLPDNAPLFYYSRAIQLLLNQEIGDSAEITATTLLVCYLFICYDHLAGNYVQATKHLRGGVEISRNFDKAILSGKTPYEDARHSEVRTLICQVTKQIRRLDMQAVTFLVDWTPADIQETLMSQVLPSDGAFQSLDQAAEYLQTLVARVMRLRNTEQQLSPWGKMPPLPSSHKDIVLGQLETWSSLFENMLQHSSCHETSSGTCPLVSLLRLQHTIAWTLLSSYGSGKEMDYDNFLPQFQYCVALASDVAAAHERYSESLRPTFTPDVGIVPVLFIIGAKCRHPGVRREVLSILRKQPIREAVWDSICVARVIERVIEVEEGGTEEGELIPVWQRIEAMSWVHVVKGQSAAKVDIRQKVSYDT